MTDPFLESDISYLFQDPLYYRLPSNTDEVFDDYMMHPENYQDNTIPKIYILQRHYDLQKDLKKIEEAGMSEDNAKKYYFYKGFVTSFEHLLFTMDQAQSETILQSEVLMLREQCHTDCENVKAMGITDENGLKYNYRKGKQKAYDQILLNSELVPL